MNGVMRKIVVLIGVLSLLTIPLVASADDGTEEAPPPSDDSQLVYYYDGFFQLFYGFFAPDGDSEACTPSETVVDEGTAPDPETVAGDGEPTPVPADECSELLIESSNGEVNHGSFLSSFVKAFKAAFEGDAIRVKPDDGLRLEIGGRVLLDGQVGDEGVITSSLCIGSRIAQRMDLPRW